jgi:hypothetical protein
MTITCTINRKGGWCKLNGSGVMDLVKTTSNTSFRRRHHSPFYNIICSIPWGLHPNVIFLETPKWESQKWDFCCPTTLIAHIFIKSKLFWKYEGNILDPSKIIPMVYSTPQLDFIWPFLSKDLWLIVKFSIWFPPIILIITHANQI